MAKATEPVILHNRSRFKSFQFTLYHTIVCAAEGRCFCGQVPKMGRDERGETVRAEQSCFILPQGYTKLLPRSVLLVPQVKQALKESPPFIEVANRLTEVQVFTPFGK